MPEPNKIRAFIELTARLACSTVLGAAVLLATIAAGKAETPPTGAAPLPSWLKNRCGVLSYRISRLVGGAGPYYQVEFTNGTNQTLQAGTIIDVTLCDKSGCRQFQYVLSDDVPPGRYIFIDVLGPKYPSLREGVAKITAPITACTARVNASARHRMVNKPSPPGTALECGSAFVNGILAFINSTGAWMKAGTSVTLTWCDDNGCHKKTVALEKDIQPGELIIVKNIAATGITTCTATIDRPFGRNRMTSVPPSIPPKQAIPPKPGLLEDGPGFSRQTPSGLGTPKPSAPPPTSVLR